MAHRVVWSPAALEDVEAIAEYIARDSAQYAAAVVRKFRDTARSLREFPRSGRSVPEFEDESIREKLVYSYRLIYRIEAGLVTIAAVVHARQSFETGVGRLGRA
ncbi:MAG TPA: type II toxin-antitoxin system RelE/ParE family toxin [Longimicrobiaceae bacterium]|nr:type II toxin-antitoxin system RelE/ParE family toxin [Longimicrobiaceae bacterium]